MSYSGRFQNSILTKQDQILKSNLIKDWRNGMYHNIPISATFNVFKYLNLTASFNFTDRMYTNKVMREWDTQQSKIVQDTTYGFYNVFNYYGSAQIPNCTDSTNRGKYSATKYRPYDTFSLHLYRSAPPPISVLPDMVFGKHFPT